MSSVSSPACAPMTRAARPRTSSAGSGFFLLGMIEEPVENASLDPDEPEPGVRPPGDLLGQPAEVDHPERDRPHRLDHEVAIAHRVQRVGRHALEAELLRGGLAIERIPGTGQRAGPERRHVGPAPGVGEPVAVALGHLDVGQQVVGEQHRLGRLDVGRPGQDGRALALGEGDQRALEVQQRDVEPLDRPAQPQPEVGRDLVVARATGVELPGDRADALREGGLEIEVDVLEVRVPGHRPVGDRHGQALQAPDQVTDLVIGQQARAAEAADMGDRPRDVVGGQLAIEVDRAREVGDPTVVLLGEPPAPQPHAPRPFGSCPVMLPA